MKLFVFCITIFLPFYSLAQSPEQIIEQFKKERQEMMSEILKMFQSNPLQDSFFDSGMHPFDEVNKLRNGSSVDVEEVYEKDGSISILIIPKSEETQLDIQTTESKIIIKSSSQVEQTTKEQGSSFKSISSQSFTRSISIPSGYMAKTPVTKDKKLIIKLIPLLKNQNKIKKETQPSKVRDLKPVGKSPGEQTI